MRNRSASSGTDCEVACFARPNGNTLVVRHSVREIGIDLPCLMIGLAADYVTDGEHAPYQRLAPPA